MKIGFSFNHCMRDILEGRVLLEDVLLLVTSTRFENLLDMEKVVDDYRLHEWYDLDRTELVTIATHLYTTGRIHQPRTFGTYRTQIMSEYAWVDLVPTSLENHPTVRDAWEQYRLVLRIINEEIPDDETQAHAIKSSGHI